MIPIKFSKKSVDFQHPGMGKDFCGRCTYFLPEQNRCKIVAGEVLAQDWCKKYREKNMYPAPQYKEHDKVKSRTTGKEIEISSGPQPGGKVFRNPFASLAQAGYLHSHPEILGSKGLSEWDAATKGKKLPKHVGKKK